MEEEIWKTVIYNGKVYNKFEVSNFGKLRNAITGHIYKLCISKTGYWQVCVSLGSRQNKKVFKIHKAVAEAFINNPEHKPFVNHIDGNKLNNNINNLECVTASENTIHAYQHGLTEAQRGEKCGTRKLTEDDVKYIREHYTPKDKTYGSKILAKKFGVSHSTISRAYYGGAWKHIA